MSGIETAPPRSADPAGGDVAIPRPLPILGGLQRQRVWPRPPVGLKHQFRIGRLDRAVVLRIWADAVHDLDADSAEFVEDLDPLFSAAGEMADSVVPVDVV